MKSIVLLALLAAGPAAAQTVDVQTACVAVAKDFLLVSQIKTGVVQAFPDLKPPGARLTYSTKADAKPEDIDETIDCQFETSAAPFKLVKFCMSSVCYSKDEEDADRRRRFEEIQSLADRRK